MMEYLGQREWAPAGEDHSIRLFPLPRIHSGQFIAQVHGMSRRSQERLVARPEREVRLGRALTYCFKTQAGRCHKRGDEWWPASAFETTVL